MEIKPPNFNVDEVQRTKECRQAFDLLTREIMCQAIKAGWRESEASIALADAAEQYVIYVATKPCIHPRAANGNAACKR